MFLVNTSFDPRFRAWSLIVDIYALLMPKFIASFNTLGISMSHYDVLVNLQIYEEMRMSELADRCVISFSRVSRVVDELEQRGLLKRKPDPDDGRAMLVAITPAGAEHISAANRQHAEDVRAYFSSHLTDEQAVALSDALEAVMAGHGRLPSPTEPMFK